MGTKKVFAHRFQAVLAGTDGGEYDGVYDVDVYQDIHNNYSPFARNARIAYAVFKEYLKTVEKMPAVAGGVIHFFHDKKECSATRFPGEAWQVPGEPEIKGAMAQNASFRILDVTVTPPEFTGVLPDVYKANNGYCVPVMDDMMGLPNTEPLSLLVLAKTSWEAQAVYRRFTAPRGEDY